MKGETCFVTSDRLKAKLITVYKEDDWVAKAVPIYRE